MENTINIDKAEKELLVIEKFRRGIIRWLVILLLVSVVFLFLRLILELFGSNPESFFVAFVYLVSGIFMLPFFGIFPEYHQTIIPGRTSTIDMAAFIALFSYIILFPVAMLIVHIVSNMLKTNKQVNETVKKNKQVDKTVINKTVE